MTPTDASRPKYDITSPTPFKLTLADARAAARKAYREGRLTAQNGGGCRYVLTLNGKDCGCAIGVALPPEIRDALRSSPTLNRSRVGGIADAGLIAVDPDDLKGLSELQYDHDEWANMRSKIVPATAYENRFRRAIGLDPILSQKAR